MKACEKATYLKEKSTMTNLSFMERLKMKIHLMMCPNCKKYAKDSDALNKMFHKYNKDQKYSDQQKAELKGKLQ